MALSEQTKAWRTAMKQLSANGYKIIRPACCATCRNYQQRYFCRLVGDAVETQDFGWCMMYHRTAPSAQEPEG